MTTLHQDLDESQINFICERFTQCDCLESLETCTVALEQDIVDKQNYTLVEGALDRMWGVYRQRKIDLQSVLDQCERFAGALSLEALKEEADQLKRHINRKPPNTFSEDAIDRMRAAYKKRFDELKGQA